MTLVIGLCASHGLMNLPPPKLRFTAAIWNEVRSSNTRSKPRMISSEVKAVVQRSCVSTGYSRPKRTAVLVPAMTSATDPSRREATRYGQYPANMVVIVMYVHWTPPLLSIHPQLASDP
jgi:hypothetical protein